MSDYLELGRVTVIRYIDEDGDDAFSIQARDMNDDALGAVEALGLLELAKLHLGVPGVIRNVEDE